MIDHRLADRLRGVARRLWSLRFLRGVAISWLALAAVGAVALNTGAIAWRPAETITLSAGLAILAAIGSARVASRATKDPLPLARRIEAAYPELDSCLLAAIEQRAASPGGHYGFLQESVIRKAQFHAHSTGWEKVAPARRVSLALVGAIAAWGALVWVTSGLARRETPRGGSSELAQSGAASAPAFSFTVEPGDVEVERGTSLLVLARYQGSPPASVTLSTQSEAGDERRLSLSKSLEDPVFGGRIPAILGPLEYHVEFDSTRSESYRVTVFEFPKLVRADAKLGYPTYTGLAEKTLEDVRVVSAAEGSELTLIFRLNKEVVSATLVEKDAAPVSLEQIAAGEPVYTTTFRVDRSRRLELNLLDDRNRRNPQPIEFTIHALPNNPPEVKVVFPARDLDVSPLEEADLKGTAWDDFGLTRVGMSIMAPGAEPQEITLATDAGAREKIEMNHLVSLEETQAEPDQLYSYYFWAEDLGPDGEPRRVMSDMFFLEVRPFEEIYRQGEQPAGGESSSQGQPPGGAANGQEAQRLAELQKEIINATWKLIRRETREKTSDAFSDDVELIHESQGKALEQAMELVERLQDDRSRALGASVTKSMLEALERLSDAKDGLSAAPLRAALAAEQAAYQGLLKTRAREFNVIRGQRSQGAAAGASGGASREQLEQLDLANEDNRYETRRAASSPEDPAARETRQVLSRLSELARRQSDLNDRLKELQTALEEAKTEEEKEEIRRQLKRLGEEEQEILRDTDELQARMESSPNQASMDESRRQLEETRDQVRSTTEALDREEVSRAAASGTRAERNFEDLRNEFRRRAAGRFQEEMRQMQQDAERLDEKEQKLAERMGTNDPAADQPRSLGDKNARTGVPEDLSRQKEDLTKLLDQMRKTIQEAESTEPLLSERLYDAARGALDQSLDRALEEAEASARQGLWSDAREREESARTGIRQLREGVDRAAESVLGDDTESLRRAREELDRLERQLDQEIARQTGRETPSQGASESPADENSRNPASGETSQANRPQEGQSGDRQPGEGQPSDRQPGERRQGQGQPGDPNSNDSPPRQQGQPQDRQPGQAQPGESQPNQGQPNQGQPGGDRSGQPTGERGPRRLTDSASPNGPTENRVGGTSTGPVSPTGPGDPGGFVPVPFDQGREFAPIAGEDFLDWSDRLRDVEEMVSDPELQAEAARVRDRARGIRADLKRNSRPPNWELVHDEVLVPLVELRDRVAEELLRRASKKAVLPLDRDPVPPKYSAKTRRYLERLGSGK